MSKQELTSLLQKYFSNEITPAEKQALAALIAQSADEELLKASVEDLWNQYQPQEQLTAADSDAYYQRIIQQIQPAGKPETRAIPMHRVHFLRRSWVRIAAAAVIVAIVGAATWYMLPSGRNGAQQAKTITPVPDRPLVRNITLPDGSKVVLQANSKLDYPASFTGKSREVTLTGEAYFDVAHNAAQPFIIHSGAITTTVLGTAFNIKAWPADKEVTVTVTRGKVQVANDSRVLGILTPDQQLTFNTQNKEAKQVAVNAAGTASWKDQEYTLDDVALDDAITEIQVRYGTLIELRGSDTVGDCRFTASFRQDESLDYVLNVISKIYKASWRKEGEKIIIENVHCN